MRLFQRSSKPRTVLKVMLTFWIILWMIRKSETRPVLRTEVQWRKGLSSNWVAWKQPWHNSWALRSRAEGLESLVTLLCRRFTLLLEELLVEYPVDSLMEDSPDVKHLAINYGLYKEGCMYFINSWSFKFYAYLFVLIFNRGSVLWIGNLRYLIWF